MPISNNKKRDYIPELAATAAATSGASLAGLGLSSDKLRLWMLRNDPEFRVQYLAGIGVGASTGSGEARMAVNNAKMARKNGINAVFVNRMARKPYGRAAKLIQSRKFTPEDRKALLELTLNGSTSADRIFNVPIGHWKKLIGNIAGGKEAKLKIVNGILTGKYDYFKIGELRDNLKIMGEDVFTVPMVSSFATDLKRNKSKYVFSGERGMGYTQHFIRDKVKNWEDGPIAFIQDEMVGADGVMQRNLARDAGFAANYNKYADKIITGSNIDDSIVNRSDFLARRKHLKDRKLFEEFLANAEEGKSILGKPVNIGGKKIIFLSNGSAGALFDQKVKETLDAIKDMDNVHLVVQTAGGFKKKHKMVDNAKKFMKSVLRGPQKNKVSFIEYVPKDLMRSLYNGADLNLGYGGSSSATELAGIRTPTIFMHDSNLNQGNIDFTKLKGRGITKDFNTTDAYIYDTVLDRLKNNKAIRAKYGITGTDNLGKYLSNDKVLTDIYNTMKWRKLGPGSHLTSIYGKGLPSKE